MMATQADVLSGARRQDRTGRTAAAAFAHLVGLAFVMSVALGILLTAAAVALPAPLCDSDTPGARPIARGTGVSALPRHAQ